MSMTGNKVMLKTPTDLAAAGRKLWADIALQYEIHGCEHLVAEICKFQDRLETIRDLMRGASPADLTRLVNAECKVAAAQARLLRLVGFDKIG